jgi:hypothetical protein
VEHRYGFSLGFLFSRALRPTRITLKKELNEFQSANFRYWHDKALTL